MGFYDNIKDAINIVQKAGNLELYKMLLDLQKDANDLLEENRLLKEKIRSIENIKDMNQNLIFTNNCYYRKSENEKIDGPFCSTCWDNHNKLIRMTEVPDLSYKSYICNLCKYFTQMD